MTRPRGAGTARLHAGGNVYDTGCQGGGDKKAGLAPTATAFMLGMPFAWRAALGGIATRGNGRANGGTRNFILSTVNQIGGVGRHRSQTSVPADGVNINHIRQGKNDCSKSVHQMSWKHVKMPNVIGGSFVGGLPQWGEGVSETVSVRATRPSGQLVKEQVARTAAYGGIYGSSVATATRRVIGENPAIGSEVGMPLFVNNDSGPFFGHLVGPTDSTNPLHPDYTPGIGGSALADAGLSTTITTRQLIILIALRNFLMTVASDATIPSQNGEDLQDAFTNLSSGEQSWVTQTGVSPDDLDVIQSTHQSLAQGPVTIDSGNINPAFIQDSG